MASGSSARKQNLRKLSPPATSSTPASAQPHLNQGSGASKDSLTGRNVLKEHTTGAPNKSNLGGKNTNS